jgi:hypothetical protein
LYAGVPGIQGTDVIFPEERGELTNESSESKSQGAVISFFVSLRVWEFTKSQCEKQRQQIFFVIVEI